MNKPGMPAEFHALVERFNQLGRLLPHPDDADFTNLHARAEARLVLQEMAQVKKQIDDFLAAARRRPPARATKRNYRRRDMTAED